MHTNIYRHALTHESPLIKCKNHTLFTVWRRAVPRAFSSDTPIKRLSPSDAQCLVPTRCRLVCLPRSLAMPSATNPSLGTSFYYENLLNVTICSFFFLPREWNHMFLELCLCIYNFHFISIVFLQTKTKPNGCKSCGHYCEIARACPNPRALWSRNKNEILDNYRIITNV